MITAPIWLAAVVVCILLGPASVAAVVAYRLASQRVDQRLARELYQPPVPPLNPQKADDIGGEG